MPGFKITGGTAEATESAQSTAEFHRSHRWSIVSIGFPSAVAGQTGSRDESPRLFAKSLKLPVLQFDEELVLGGSSYYTFAKAAAWQSAEVTFYDVFGLFNLLAQWQQLIWSPANGLNVADIYKGNPQFDLLDGAGTAVLSFKMTGAWPKAISHGEMSYTSSEIKSVTLNYAYDFAEISPAT